ncbi:Type I Iterative Polyketide synthase (PKS) [Apiospora sp. TS-2023a]
MEEPIAVIGLDAVFPAEADSAERFYQLLLEGKSARTSVPRDRYHAEAYWHPDLERAGAVRNTTGHYLKQDVAAFDAPFFSITAEEAGAMDPQQRALLEGTYRALENATTTSASSRRTSSQLGQKDSGFASEIDSEPESQSPPCVSKSGIDAVRVGVGVAQVVTQAVASPPRPEQEPRIFVWSAHDRAGLARLRDAYRAYSASKAQVPLSKDDEPSFLRDLSYTLSARRTHHGWRSYGVAQSVDDLSRLLSNEEEESAIISRSSRVHSDPQLALVFTGQGAQWPAMGKELFAYPVFEESLREADRYLTSLGCPWSLIAELLSPVEASNIDDLTYCQPICTALQVALVDLLESWGFTPRAVIGHSSGEIAAAYAAGHLSRQAAWKITYFRGKLSGRLCDSSTMEESPHPRTTMTAVGLDLTHCTRYIDKVQALQLTPGGGRRSLEVACMNSPQSQTISGTVAEVDALVAMLQEQGSFARKLNVSVGYHSRFMMPIAEEYATLIGDGGIEERRSEMTGNMLPRFFSSTYGSNSGFDLSELQQASYWVKNLVSPVRFHEAAVTMLKEENADSSSRITDLLEVGPHGALRGGPQQHYDDASSQHQGGKSSTATTMLTDLPPYPFNHTKRYWSESRIAKNFRFPSAGRHELLGRPLVDVDDMGPAAPKVWRNWMRDLALALGKVRGESFSGLEASGVVTRAGASSSFRVDDRVFGLATCSGGALGGGFKTRVRSRDGLLARLPDDDDGGISWAQAAALPLVYTTAYGCLCERDPLRDHIFSSRDLSFQSQLLRRTNGRGVDVVLNSLAGEALRASWDCVAPFGRFVELGTGDMAANAPLGMANFARHTRFEAFDLSYLVQQKDPVIRCRTQRMFQGAMQLVLGPQFRDIRGKMPVTVFPMSDVQGAFRHMQAAKHIGKLVLEPRSDQVVPILPRTLRASFDADASYVIAGGLGGLGKSIVSWMVSRGARHLILLSRSGAETNPGRRSFVQTLEAQGVTVAAPPCDVSFRDTLQGVIRECLEVRGMLPIKGCVQGSMVLKLTHDDAQDKLLSDMSLEEWHAAIKPKVDGSWNLHHVLGPGLDFFILLSSATGVIGLPEQSNYAAGTAFQDSLARYRVMQGSPAISLDLPSVADVGFVAERPEILESLRNQGLDVLPLDEFLAVLDYYCGIPAERRKLTVADCNVVFGLALPRELEAEGITMPPLCHKDPLFRHLLQAGHSTNNSQLLANINNNKQEPRHCVALAACSSAKDAHKMVLDALVGKLARILGVEPADALDPARPLHALGIDSLVSVELRSWLARELGVQTTVLEMAGKASVRQLAEAAMARSQYTPKFKEA